MATKRDFVIAYGLQADKSTGSSDTLFVDYINDRVGIGTLSPTQKLHVQGNLHVTGNLTVDGTYPSGGGGGGSSISLGNTSVSITDTGSNGTITFATEGTTAMTVTSSQKVGIGVLNPFFNLEVAGSMVASSSLYLGSSLDFSLQNNFLQLTDGQQTNFNISVPQLRLSIYGQGEQARLTSTGLGIGTTNPQFKGDVNGDFRIQSANKLRFGGTTTTTNFYVQYNSATNSLDFIAG